MWILGSRYRETNGQIRGTGMNEPVCLLLRNLNGHKLADLLWQKWAEEKIISLGFEKLVEWEFVCTQNIEVMAIHICGRSRGGRIKEKPSPPKLRSSFPIEK